MDPTLVTVSGITMIVAGVGLLVLVFRKSTRFWPTDSFQWISAVLSTGAVACGIAVLVLGSSTPVSIAKSTIASADEILEMDLHQKTENFSFELVADGSVSSLDAYRGKVVIVNAWATWCGPCLEEIPDLNRLQKAYEDRGLVVLSISDEERSELLAFEQLLPMVTYTGFVDPGAKLPKAIQEAFSIRPTSYIIDRDGLYRKYILGARDYAYFERAIQPYL